MHKIALLSYWKTPSLVWVLGMTRLCVWTDFADATDWKVYQLASFRACDQCDAPQPVDRFEIASNAVDNQTVSDSELAMLYKVLATAYYADKRYARAQETVNRWDEVLARNPGTDWAAKHRRFRDRLARLLDGLGDQAPVDDKELANLYKVLAQAHFTEGRYRRAQEAMQQWDDVIARNPGTKWVAYHLFHRDRLDRLMDEAGDETHIENASPRDALSQAEILDIRPAAARPNDEAESASPVSSHRYGIHLSSYDSEESARIGWTELKTLYPTLLNGTALVIHRVDLGKRGVFYRVLAGAFDNADRAESICSKFSSLEQYCAVVSFD